MNVFETFVHATETKPGSMYAVPAGQVDFISRGILLAAILPS